MFHSGANVESKLAVRVPFGPHAGAVCTVQDHYRGSRWSEGCVLPDEFSPEVLIGGYFWIESGRPHEVEGGFDMVLDPVPFVGWEVRVCCGESGDIMVSPGPNCSFRFFGSLLPRGDIL